MCGVDREADVPGAPGGVRQGQPWQVVLDQVPDGVDGDAALDDVLSCALLDGPQLSEARVQECHGPRPVHTPVQRWCGHLFLHVYRHAVQQRHEQRCAHLELVAQHLVVAAGLRLPQRVQKVLSGAAEPRVERGHHSWVVEPSYWIEQVLSILQKVTEHY